MQQVSNESMSRIIESSVQGAVENAVKSEFEKFGPLLTHFRRATVLPPVVPVAPQTEVSEVPSDFMELPNFVDLAEKLENVWLLYNNENGYGKFHRALKDLSSSEIMEIIREPDGKLSNSKRLIYAKILKLIDFIRARALETNVSELQAARNWDCERMVVPESLNFIAEGRIKRSHKRKNRDECSH